MKAPNAPSSAVDEITKTFRGVSEHGTPKGWRVKFDNSSDEQNAIHLINMLKGWRAEPHLNCKNMIQIYSV